MTMNFQIAIPSYLRAQTLRNKTIAYLERCGVNFSRVTVFVADEDERKMYEDFVPPECQIVVGKPGMRAIRNFIQDFYPEGERVLNLDDDLDSLIMRLDEKESVPFYDLIPLANQGFEFCSRTGTRLWGVYPVDNPYFMKPTVSFDLKYIVGTVWGCINTQTDALRVTLDDKEDFERTIKCYLEGGSVVRFNHIACRTNYYGEPGGMQVERTEQRVTESAKFLAKKYPHLCSLNATKKSGHLELRLRDKRGKK